MALLSIGMVGHKARSVTQALKLYIASGKAAMRALAYGAPLPPGSLRLRPCASLDDQRLLLDRARTHGPIFKIWLDGKLTICIFGLADGRQFLAENEGRIRTATTDFTGLFRHGALRQMTGDAHREYRRRFVEAMRAVPLRENRAAPTAHVDRLVRSLAGEPAPMPMKTVSERSKRCLTDILLGLLLGIDRDWHGYDELTSAYDRFTPNGMFVVQRPEHVGVYGRIAELVLKRAAELVETQDGTSLLGQLAISNKLDETAVGNLIQMVEAGRFDMMGLWTWLVKLLGDNPHFIELIAATAEPVERLALCQAAVQETLRLEQSEFLLRSATANIRFGRFLIPKGSRVRIAVWESHKDASHFDDPFRFHPQRFTGHAPSSDRFAPFGLDSHRCLGADWVLLLSALFVDRLAAQARWTSRGDATTARRGVFHFEPDPRQSIEFLPRTAG